MAEVGSEAFAVTEEVEGARKKPRAGVEAGSDFILRLEENVERAVARIVSLREERDALRVALSERDERIAEFEAAGTRAAETDEAMTRLRAERDALLRERAGTTARVEGILARLDTLGLD